jgi:hypothetical protein
MPDTSLPRPPGTSPSFRETTMQLLDDPADHEAVRQVGKVGRRVAALVESIEERLS